MSNITSKVGVTIKNEIDYVLLNRDNSAGGAGAITDVPTKVQYASAYTNPNSNLFTTNLFVPTANVTFNINTLSILICEFSFTVNLLGTSNRDVIFYLGNSVGDELSEPRRFSKVSENQSVSFHDCKYLTSGEYFMWMYYDDTTGSGTDITIDHPVFLIKKV